MYVNTQVYINNSTLREGAPSLMFCVFWDCALAKMQCVRVCVRVPAIAWLTVPLPRGFAAVFVVTVVVAAASLCLRAPTLLFLHLCSGFSGPAELLQQLLNKTCPCKRLSATHFQKTSRRERLKLRLLVGMQRYSTDIHGYSADESGEPLLFPCGVYTRLGCSFDRNVMDYNDILFRNSSSSPKDELQLRWSPDSSLGIIIWFTDLCVSHYKGLEKFMIFLQASATLCHVSSVTF